MRHARRGPADNSGVVHRSKKFPLPHPPPSRISNTREYNKVWGITFPDRRCTIIPAAIGCSRITATTERSCSTRPPRGSMTTLAIVSRPDGGLSTGQRHPTNWIANPPRAASSSKARNSNLPRIDRGTVEPAGTAHWQGPQQERGKSQQFPQQARQPSLPRRRAAGARQNDVERGRRGHGSQLPEGAAPDPGRVPARTSALPKSVQDRLHCRCRVPARGRATGNASTGAVRRCGTATIRLYGILRRLREPSRHGIQWSWA